MAELLNAAKVLVDTQLAQNMNPGPNTEGSPDHKHGKGKSQQRKADFVGLLANPWSKIMRKVDNPDSPRHSCR
jgi:hypothetical protein